jgi:hypothetical protein
MADAGASQGEALPKVKRPRSVTEAFVANDDDLEARQGRAANLREQIASLTGKPKAQPAEGAAAAGGEPAADARRNAPRIRPPSPRDFIERRMRELDAGNQDEADGGPKK